VASGGLFSSVPVSGPLVPSPQLLVPVSGSSQPGSVMVPRTVTVAPSGLSPSIVAFTCGGALVTVTVVSSVAVPPGR
jgi:hypothetical protein